jgi:hypothetical protein
MARFLFAIGEHNSSEVDAMEQVLFVVALLDGGAMREIITVGENGASHQLRGRRATTCCLDRRRALSGRVGSMAVPT